MRGPKKERKADPLRALRMASHAEGPAESNHRTVFDQETQAASMVGGRRHAGSGSMDGLKSDASSDRYQIEAKQTKHEQIALKLEWLKKISYEAFGKAKVPFVHIRFLN